MNVLEVMDEAIRDLYRDFDKPLMEVAERKATANLFKSAPDLYEALEDLYNAIDSSVELTPELLKRCSAALAKANGASHE